MPFELLYGMKQRTPSWPAQDIQRELYRESFVAEILQILQKARQIAKEHIEEKQNEYRVNMTRKHNCVIFTWDRGFGICKQTF